MRNIKLVIQYDGTKYCGWQIQHSRKARAGRPRLKTIQGAIEKAIERVTGEQVLLIGSGRTDAGVHALVQVANFKTSSRIEAEKIKQALNSVLAASIRIKQASDVKLDFNSQHQAHSKVYSYLILNSQAASPFLLNYAYHLRAPLDILLMKQEAKCLLGKHDFKSFCASGSKVKHTIRTIIKINVSLDGHFTVFQLNPDDKLIIITIEADGFLYNMARIIAGTLIDAGRGHLGKGDTERILKAKNRKAAGMTAPAKGLYLCEVKYE